MSPDFVYLASASPRRRELLEQIGVLYQRVEISVDESVRAGELPAQYVVRLAAAKACAGRACAGRASAVGAPTDLDRPVLAADTAVVVEGEIFGKPADRADAQRMLRRLSGRTHEVFTAVALAVGGTVQSRLSRSEVTFRSISADEMEAYWDCGEPRDKAGAYAIQGRAAVFVVELRGSYSGVMGLPLYETAELLADNGAALWTAGR